VARSHIKRSIKWLALKICFNLLKPSGYLTYNQVWHLKILRFARRVYLYVLYGSQDKTRLFYYAALTDWFYNRDGVFTARYGLNLCISSLVTVCTPFQASSTFMDVGLSTFFFFLPTHFPSADLYVFVL
jgi:hypothetical protein